MNRLEGKKIIVLGGTSGIGLATVEALISAGADVVAGGRSEIHIPAAREATGGAARFVQVDVLDREALAALFQSEAPIDHLVSTATGGGRAVGSFAEMDLDGFEGSFRKLWGYVNATRLVLEHLSESGSITIVRGSPAKKCKPGMSAISTVGNAVEGFARAVAAEIAPRRMNVVSPGLIDTPMFTGAKEQLAAMAQDTLIARPGRPEEVAEAILLTLTNAFMTGAVIDIDGGAPLP
jgi:NAD(P)-dependent dehydrogenase (short-subunit alcohol dehydrogenase family)